MVRILYENGQRLMRGENISRQESWEGIGTFWNGYSALLTDIAGGKKLVIMKSVRAVCPVVDREFWKFDRMTREALCFYYGLQTRPKQTIDMTATLLNTISETGSHFTDYMVNEMINDAIKELANNSVIIDYIAECGKKMLA